MKNYKIFSLGLIIFGLILASCASYSSQESFSSSFISSEESSLRSSSISSEPSSSLIEQPQYVLEPISDELISFYMENAYSKGSASVRESFNIKNLYKYHKSIPEELDRWRPYYWTYNLYAENRLHCYYVNKDLHEAVNEQLKQGRRTSDIFLPWRGLTAYVEGFHYYHLSASVEDPQIMDVDFDVNVDFVPLVLNDYYLLDIVRYYNEPSFEDYYIDFVDYFENDGKAIFDISNMKSYIKFGGWPYNPNAERQNHYHFYYNIDYFSFEIMQENCIEVVKEKFTFSRLFDYNYYDDIESCIIEKTLIESNQDYDEYYVTFDYNKIIKLFDLIKNDE